MAKCKELESLATKCVGDGKTQLLFVSDDSGVLAVFVGRQLRSEATNLADSFADPCWVEDKTGVFYDNKASERRQREEED